MKKILRYLLIIICFLSNLLLISCDNNKQISILHSGGEYDGQTYLNAMETFDYYYEKGYRYFEYDLRLSIDGKLIGVHDQWSLGVDNIESITYDEFLKLKLPNGFTPINENWLMETIIKHPDVIIIVDAKMDDERDTLVLQRLEELENIYNIDISKNIIPEVFSKEMWDIVKETTTFDKYLFSYYKVNYSIDFILEHFLDKRIYGIAFDINTDKSFTDSLDRFREINKKLFAFTITNKEELELAISLRLDGIYIDHIL